MKTKIITGTIITSESTTHFAELRYRSESNDVPKLSHDFQRGNEREQVISMLYGEIRIAAAKAYQEVRAEYRGANHDHLEELFKPLLNAGQNL